MDADFTRFESDSTLTGQPNARRLFSKLQVNRSWQTPAGFITPRRQLHATNYQFDAPLSNGDTPVSYTHRDVYKRQGWQFSCAGGASMMIRLPVAVSMRK